MHPSERIKELCAIHKQKISELLEAEHFGLVKTPYKYWFMGVTVTGMPVHEYLRLVNLRPELKNEHLYQEAIKIWQKGQLKS